MRTILSVILLFCTASLHAQAFTPSWGRELPRNTTIVYPTAEAASAADGDDNRYYTRIREWSLDGNVLSANFTRHFIWANRQVLFHVGSLSSDYEIRVNGQTAAYVADGNAPCEINITRLTQEGRNLLELVLAEPSPVTPLESWKDGPSAERDIVLGQTWIVSQPTMRIRDILTRTTMEGSDAATAEIGIVVKSEALNPRTSRIHYELLSPTGELAAAGHKDLTLDMRREDTLRFLARIPANLLWTAELPTEYTLRLKTQHEGRYGEYLERRIGLRAVEVAADGQLSVNGEPVSLRVRVIDPELLDENLLAKLREAGFNALKFRPGPVAPSVLHMCDEQGMYVIVQAPIDTSKSGDSRRKGGNPSNDPAWKAAFVERAEDSYHTTKSHPSVIAFSLAENSSNGINLYESYLNLKRFGDSRPIIYLEAEGEWNNDPLKTEWLSKDENAKKM